MIAEIAITFQPATAAELPPLRKAVLRGRHGRVGMGLAYWWEQVFPYPVVSKPMTAASDIPTVATRSGRGGRRGRPHLRHPCLTHAGYSVTDVEDGQQALQALEIERSTCWSPISSCLSWTESRWR